MAYEIVVHELAVKELELLRAFDTSNVAEKELQQNLDSILTRAQIERIYRVSLKPE